MTYKEQHINIDGSYADDGPTLKNRDFVICRILKQQRRNCMKLKNNI